jgi:hypothetical protein
VGLTACSDALEKGGRGGGTFASVGLRPQESVIHA